MIPTELRSVFDCLLDYTFEGIYSITIYIRQYGGCNTCQLEVPEK